MSQPLQTTDEAIGSNVLKNLLLTIADQCDRVRPGAGDCVREMANEKYPEHRCMTHREMMQHLANLCDRHKRDLLPAPTESVCADCVVELKAR